MRERVGDRVIVGTHLSIDKQVHKMGEDPRRVERFGPEGRGCKLDQELKDNDHVSQVDHGGLAFEAFGKRSEYIGVVPLPFSRQNKF